MRPHNKQSGISLIEMMISLAILAIGLLALAATQSRAMMMNQSAYFRSVAADLAADLSDRIRANRTPFLTSDDLAITPLKPPNFDDTACPHTTVGDEITCGNQPADRMKYRAAKELTEWGRLLKNTLPGAGYTITSVSNPNPPPTPDSLGLRTYTVTITWIDDRSQKNPIDGTYTTTIDS
ncbi:type IV pilus modification protein PilV [Chitinimonas sp. BJB300]|uniref:type IV pilus modification protein PilV n=1 Tax=Chitinimonas sp. BJB300 TaxID=1559339 RepID=UPI000C1097D1|nr:type IV pilus modification protein PilV [Chitinimonas sp. BJB300]PHV11428.1 type IV pilus modification protein PilV [Chitinimonas sp. BJB300]TSJ91497.1 type IV pilus modification protein PilV [Chitinimonas sp. BJB300]